MDVIDRLKKERETAKRCRERARELNDYEMARHFAGMYAGINYAITFLEDEQSDTDTDRDGAR